MALYLTDSLQATNACSPHEVRFQEQCSQVLAPTHQSLQSIMRALNSQQLNVLCRTIFPERTHACTHTAYRLLSVCRFVRVRSEEFLLLGIPSAAQGAQF